MDRAAETPARCSIYRRRRPERTLLYHAVQAACHGPYYEWGHMKRGRLVHRSVSPQQAAILQLAIANYRKVKKLLRSWEVETERLIDVEEPPQK